MMHSIEFTAGIVNAARSWIGTPFHHQGRQKGVGCDCLGLLMGVAQDLKLHSRTGELLIKYDRIDYHYRRDAHLLMQKLSHHLHDNVELAVGHVIVLELQRQPQHLGIVAEYGGEFSLIHACMRCQKVVEQPLRHNLRQQICAILAF